ncbi:MAG: hypothetical protein ACE5GB_12900, partial [Acidimicrobiales bacterium]
MATIGRPAPAGTPEEFDAGRPDRFGQGHRDLSTLFGLATALIGAGIGARRLSDNSFWTHLATGREMLESGVVRTDRFT